MPRRPLTPEDRIGWAEVSTFATRERAEYWARVRPALGQFIAELDVPDDVQHSYDAETGHVGLQGTHPSNCSVTFECLERDQKPCNATRYEIWSLTSGNRLAVFPQIDDAILWTLAIRDGEGDAAVENLSGGHEGQLGPRGVGSPGCSDRRSTFPTAHFGHRYLAGNPIEGAIRRRLTGDIVPGWCYRLRADGAKCSKARRTK